MPLVAQHSYIDVSTSLQTPSNSRQATVNKGHHHSSRQSFMFGYSQSKAAPSRGISPRMNRNLTLITTSSSYDPTSIERV
jgi:hypothetical protein